MKLQLKILGILVLFAAALAACARGESTAPALPDGPALVMFYTDG